MFRWRLAGSPVECSCSAPFETKALLVGAVLVLAGVALGVAGAIGEDREAERSVPEG